MLGSELYSMLYNSESKQICHVVLISPMNPSLMRVCECEWTGQVWVTDSSPLSNWKQIKVDVWENGIRTYGERERGSNENQNWAELYMKTRNGEKLARGVRRKRRMNERYIEKNHEQKDREYVFF